MTSVTQGNSDFSKSAKQLKLTHDLEEFPDSIFDLSDSLEILDLSGNKLRKLPKNFSRLTKLKILFLSNNYFEEIPEVLAECPNLSMLGFKSNKIKEFSETCLPPSLRWLILTNNQISQIPRALGRCTQLQKLMLAGNRIQSLPRDMRACENLELLRISANAFTEVPPWLFELPKLSWLAISGNSLATVVPVRNTEVPEISLDALSIGEVLGEGASGIIYQASWYKSASETIQVAVKVFKGDVTSDGYPEDEMQTWLQLPSHPNLHRVLAILTPSGSYKAGLVFSLIEKDYINLAQPPSFESCTRDVYPPAASFSLQTILKILSSVCAAVQHLHAQRIMHGDLYAHNILVNQEAEVLLGDFGAASTYASKNALSILPFEKVEVRAFGCLVEELLERTSIQTASDKQLLTSLEQIRDRCLLGSIQARPAFHELFERFSKLLCY